MQTSYIAWFPRDSQSNFDSFNIEQSLTIWVAVKTFNGNDTQWKFLAARMYPHF